MSETPSSDHARWIVLTGSPSSDAWMAALADAAAAAGLVFVDWSRHSPAEALRNPRALIVATSVAIARSAQARIIASIVPDPEHSAAPIGQQHDAVLPQSLWMASLFVAEACSPSPPHPVIDADAIAAAKGPIEIAPDLHVTRPPPTPPAAFASPVERAAGKALALYRSGRPQIGAVVTLDPEIFLYDERASKHAPEVGDIDVTGRPRPVIYGLYVALTPGIWRATMRFSLDDDAARHEYRIDWGQPTEFASHTITPGGAGLFEISLDYAWTAPATSEFRIITLEGVFAGQLKFLGGTAELIADAANTQGA